MAIALIDYGAGNLTSVRKGFAAAGAELFTPERPSDLERAAAIVVPGVGHFNATAALDDEWRDAIGRTIEAGTPLLGICLGMQFLFDGSEEAPGVPGLGIIPGVCTRLRGGLDGRFRAKVPHVGWNMLRETRQPSRLPLVTGTNVYFTHSYAAPAGPATVATCEYGGDEFAAVVEQGQVFGVQFHPEKSGDAGVRILERFVAIAEDRARHRRAPPEPGPPRATAQGGPGDEVPRTGMLCKRIIACLDVRDGCVVKGVNFEGLREAGDPAALARRYNTDGIDEIVILDVTATIEGRRALHGTIAAVSRELFIPLVVGGGIRSEADAGAALDAGADKVSLNTAALENPALLTRLASRYGSQAVVVAVDAKREDDRYAVFKRSGQAPTGRGAVEWAREAESRGAGEILLTSIDRDGTRAGFDCALTAAVSDAVSIPVIASGGAGTFEHFFDVFTAGRAEAALAASVFHYAEHPVADLKAFLSGRGIPVRTGLAAHKGPPYTNGM